MATITIPTTNMAIQLCSKVSRYPQISITRTPIMAITGIIFLISKLHHLLNVAIRDS